MPNYASNSDKARANVQSEENPKKVISGNATLRTPTKTSAVKGTFKQVWDDLMFPALQKLAVEAGSSLLRMFIYKNTGYVPDNSPNRDYGRYWDQNKTRPLAKPANVYSRQNVYDYQDILFDSFADAQQCIDYMQDYLNHYGSVSVNELYDRAGLVPNNPQMARYGWTNLNGARPVQINDPQYGMKYMIDFPRRATPIA